MANACFVYTIRYICIMKFIPKSEKTRQFIIKTTAGIFNRKGYAGTSLADLTEATQLTKGSIYGNFENKEEVAVAVFDYNLALRKKIVNDRLMECTTYKEKIIAFAYAHKSSETDFFANGGCPVLNTAVEANHTNETLRKRAAEALLTWKNSLGGLLKQGISNREFKPETDINKVALSIVALIEGAVLIGSTTQNPDYTDIILDSIKDLIQKIEL